ncbi:341_t:CDS:2 [Entrophospora sp. SA101]|nr:341_t:CDS:2 [Entrophospora sp. SA101]
MDEQDIVSREYLIGTYFNSRKFDLTSNTLKEQQILLLKEKNRYYGYEFITAATITQLNQEFIAAATTTQLNQEYTTTTTTQPTQEFIFH